MPPKKPPAGNPQWVEWVEEMAANAEEKGLKSFQSFKKAAAALRKCPITYTHPQEAQCLSGVGPGIVASLCKKLQKWCDDNYEDFPEPPQAGMTASAAKKAEKGQQNGGAAAGGGGARKESAAAARKRLAEEEHEAGVRAKEAKRARTIGYNDDAPQVDLTGIGGLGGFNAQAAAAGPAGGGGGVARANGNGNGGGWGQGHVLGGAPAGPAPGVGGVGGGGGKKRPLQRDSPDSDEDRPNSSGPAKRKGSTKDYVPKKNSGAYAILLALYLLVPSNSPSSFLEAWALREPIIAKGSPYSSTSFEVASGNGGNGGGEYGGKGTYTAWNSMRTLLEKELVVTDNKRPKRWRLTRRGYDLAHLLAGKEEDIVRHDQELMGVDGFVSTGEEEVVVGKGKGKAVSNSGGSGSGSGGVKSNVKSNGKKKNSINPNALFPFNFDSDSDEDEIQPPRAGPAPRDRQFEPEPEPEPLDEEAKFLRDMEIAMAASMVEAEPARRPLPPPPAPAPVARPVIPLPKPKPLERDRDEALLSSETGSSGFGAGAGGLRLSSGGHLDGRKAATGGYARNVVTKEPEKNLGVDGAFGYFYLDSDGKRHLDRKKAEVSQDDNGDAVYRIEYRAGQDLHVMVKSLLRVEKVKGEIDPDEGSTKSACLRHRMSNERAPGFPEDKTRKKKSGGSGSGVEKGAERIDPFQQLLGNQVPKKKTDNSIYNFPAEVTAARRDLSRDGDSSGMGMGGVQKEKRKENRPSLSSSSQPTPVASTSAATNLARTKSAPVPPVASGSGIRHTAASSAAPLPRPAAPAPVVRPLPPAARPAGPSGKKLTIQASFDRLAIRGSQTIINRHPLDPVKDHETTYEPDFQLNPIIIPAGSFKVVLIVDTRELGLKVGGKRTELVDALAGQGVDVDRKMLPLGDMIWVARRVDKYRRPTGEPDVVLDSIVERKRLDDLVGSIKDGRYTDQKVRIKDSGIRDRIYLIEKYDVATYDATYRKQIWTAKSQLQINDGFYVYESANIKDTVNFLKIRTQVMSELYANRELKVIPDQHINRPTYLGLQKHLRCNFPGDNYLTTYTGFDALNKSDAAQTLGQQFGSMVLRIAGVSAEKAGPFIERWPTARTFYKEARAHELEVERDNGERETEWTEGGSKGKFKKRKVEDYIVEQLGTDDARGIKGKLGAKIWTLFSAKGRYEE